MAEAVRACEGHGYFAGERCPDCGDAGRRVLSGDRREQLSKFLSGALRHFPDDAGLALDGAGWAEYEAVVATVESRYDWADSEAVDAVVATDPKGRFERTTRNGTALVRAAYGHSVAVTLDDRATPVPDTLYHGTAPRNLDPILAEGLKPMSRQQVHLSGTPGEARAVGRRHADEPVILAVDAAAMAADGYCITKRGRETYTTDRVPPGYLERSGE